jgi:hypothetical protein
MGITITVYPVMPTRPCSFCLCLQEGSVFADFDVDGEGVVSLRRISFDGFGCCYPAAAAVMSLEDSRELREAVASETVAGPRVAAVLRRFFEHVQDVLWKDALEEHGLL